MREPFVAPSLSELGALLILGFCVINARMAEVTLGIKTIVSAVVSQIFSAVVRGAFWCSLTIWGERGRLCDYVCIRSHCAHAELMQS